MAIEPRYTPISELKFGKGHIPEDIRDLVEQRHVRSRNEISKVLGEIELAYRRGYQAGYEAKQAERSKG